MEPRRPIDDPDERFTREVTAYDEDLREGRDSPSQATDADGESSRLARTLHLVRLLHEAFPRDAVGQSRETALVRPNANAPAKIGRFVTQEVLGEGAFGHVYRAHDPQLGRDVALKVAKPGGEDIEQRLKRFAREAKTAASLRHPNLVALYEYGEDAGFFYIAFA